MLRWLLIPVRHEARLLTTVTHIRFSDVSYEKTTGECKITEQSMIANMMKKFKSIIKDSIKSEMKDLNIIRNEIKNPKGEMTIMKNEMTNMRNEISAWTNVEDLNALAKFGGDTRDSNLIISYVTLFTTK